jgi:hypothetical protein
MPSPTLARIVCSETQNNLQRANANQLTHIGGRNKSGQPLEEITAGSRYQQPKRTTAATPYQQVHEFVLVFCIGLHFVSNDRHSRWFDCYGWHHKEEQQQFWVDITDMNGVQAAQAADLLVSSVEVKKEFYQDGGEYLPLGVWATRGFNPKNIEDRSRESDVMEDAVLGTVYRVRILSKGNEGSRATVLTRNLKRKESTDAIGNGSGSSRDHLALAGRPGLQAVEDGTPPASPSGSSSTTTSDSSDSSSDSDKKKKKSKKHKKSKKGKKGKKSNKDKKDKKKSKKEKKEQRAIKDLSCTTVNLAACRFLLCSHHS